MKMIRKHPDGRWRLVRIWRSHLLLIHEAQELERMEVRRRNNERIAYLKGRREEAKADKEYQKQKEEAAERRRSSALSHKSFLSSLSDVSVASDQ